MNENKKNNYTAPAVKVVAFQVEQGFAGSVQVGDGEATPTPILGTTQVRTDATSDSWAGSVIPH